MIEKPVYIDEEEQLNIRLYSDSPMREKIVMNLEKSRYYDEDNDPEDDGINNEDNGNKKIINETIIPINIGP